jgi:hypothetical protein
VRIALNAIGDVGVRTGRILTAERDLAALGLYGDTASLGQERRTIRISSLQGFDLLVTDDAEEGSALARLAGADGLSCALPGDAPDDVRDLFERSESSVLITRCSIEGLAETLAAHQATRADDIAETVIAWTEEGKPLRNGEPVAFPDPVGARWGKRQRSAGTTTRIAVPVDSDWAGATATVIARTGRGRERRIVGVADQVRHLEALALAAGAVAAVRTDLTGVITPQDVGEDYLAIALSMGLGVAAYTLD